MIRRKSVWKSKKGVVIAVVFHLKLLLEVLFIYNWRRYSKVPQASSNKNTRQKYNYNKVSRLLSLMIIQENTNICHKVIFIGFCQYNTIKLD